MLQSTDSNQQKGIAMLVVLRTRHEVESNEPALAAQESLRRNGRSAGMTRRRAGPLQSVRLQPGVAYAAEKLRSDSRNFVDYVRRTFVRPARAHFFCYVANHFPVRTRA